MQPPPMPGAAPLPMATLFGPLLETARQTLLQEGFVETALPPEWAWRLPVSGAMTPELQSWAGMHPIRGTRWSAAHIRGPRTEILNLMIYPRDAKRVPVFAVEYISFGGRPRVAVVDLQPAAGLNAAPDLTAEVVAALNSRGADELRHALPGGGDLPEWAVPHFTPASLYSRPTSPDGAEISLLAEAFRCYLDTWRVAFLPRDNGGPATADELGATHLTAYQQHHVEHTPGRPFLRKTYGEEWTERYLRDFMYRSGA
ncbi:MAG: hypothetical protein ACAI35_04800 [Candidatus Methylacidiphilales bacterium]